MVPVLECCCIEATEGLVDNGGEGSVYICGALAGVVDVGELAGPATLGDCKGDWIGAGLVFKSIISGGRSGVPACPWSSVSSGSGFSALRADEMASLKLSSRFVLAGEGRR
jgi:hypothetical protein